MSGKGVHRSYRLISTTLMATPALLIGTALAGETRSHPATAPLLATCPLTLHKNGTCNVAGYDFESIVFNADPDDSDLPLVLALHWSSSEPKELLKELGPQTARFRMILPYAIHRKRDGFSFFAPDFYDQSLHDQREGVKQVAARIAIFATEIQKAYRCFDPILVMGASQGGDLSFQLAHDHPNLVAAAFPMLGRNLIGRSAAWKRAAPVQAYFSLTDPIVDKDQAEASIDTIRDSGGTVERRDFVADGHDISEAMAASLAKALHDRMSPGCKEPNRDRSP